MALNCWLTPTATTALTGVTAIDISVGVAGVAVVVLLAALLPPPPQLASRASRGRATQSRRRDREKVMAVSG